MLEFPAPTFEQAQRWYVLARSNFVANHGNATSAWKFAEAVFEWAEYASNATQRADLAREGISAARFAVEKAPDEVAGHFYLAMNKGQLARTKTLGALPLVKEMEVSFLQAIKLDPKFDNAAVERSLGMLYLDAPGWPASIGSRLKARQHLERAVELVPEYPTNHLKLMEAYLEWNDSDALKIGMDRYRRLISEAKEQFSGEKWKQSWINWDAKWEEIQDKVRGAE